jgi:hypothetical protein
MKMSDTSGYTGVDVDPAGVFGNEELPKETQRILQEQEHQLKELTPKLQNIVDMLDAEVNLSLNYIADYVDKTKDDDNLYRAELKAAAMYRVYLQDLKTKFALALDATRGRDD